MSHGYNGKILHVDLTSRQLSVEEPEEAFYRKYMGGSALAMYYLLRDMPPGVDSLGPDNDVRQPADRRADLRAEPDDCSCQITVNRCHW